MKKVILSLVAACAISTAFAQNTASLSQTGSSNSSSTTQTGTGQHAVIVQNGNGNKNTNTQVSVFGPQNTNVTQLGNYNTALTSQDNNAGPSNLINILQTGDGTSAVGVRNTATVNQSAYWTINSTATVTQRGHNMNATVNQLGAYNDQAIIQQAGVGGLGTDGGNQTATINQGNSGTGSGSSITSTGDYAFIQQFSVFAQTATINQTGTTNQAYIYQNDNAGPGDIATITQKGISNYAKIDQSDFENIGVVGTITQTGNNNLALLDQKGVTGNFATGTATITQTGNLNVTRFHQDGGLNNNATISQTGGGNVVQGLAGSGSFALQNGGGGNTLTITQTSLPAALAGAGQVASVSQVGTGNTGTITQN